VHGSPALPPPSRRRTGYNARVDRLNAIRLLQALVAAGAKPRAPMDSAWIDKIAVRDVSLHGTELASALAYAEGERWLADSRTRKDWIYLTRTGEIVAKESVTYGHYMRSWPMEGREMAVIRHLKVVRPANVKRTVALPVRKPNAAYIPAQCHQLRGPEAVAVSDQDRRGVAMPRAVLLGGLSQPLDLALGQVFAGPSIGLVQSSSCGSTLGADNP
jgi:hypothetical protein